MEKTEEIAVIKECLQGSGEAYRKLVGAYMQRCIFIAYKMVGNQETAEDIAQDAFIRIFKNLHRFDLKRNFYTWLYQIVVNLSIDHMRKVKGKQTVDIEKLGGMPDLSKDPAKTMGRRELEETVHRILMMLPDKYQSVLNLRDIQGFSCKEIAEIVNCTNATVRWRLHQARKMFKGIWQEHAEVADMPSPQGEAG